MRYSGVIGVAGLNSCGDCGLWTAHPLELGRCRKVASHGVSNCGACDCEQPHQFSGHSACPGGP